MKEGLGPAEAHALLIGSKDWIRVLVGALERCQGSGFKVMKSPAKVHHGVELAKHSSRVLSTTCPFNDEKNAGMKTHIIND